MPQKKIICPAELTLSILSGKWKLKIIHRLINGPKRFNQLQRDIGKITHHSLSQQLKQMEKDGLITRIDFIENPPHVEYCLSELGQSLTQVFKAMHTWGELYKQSKK